MEISYTMEITFQMVDVRASLSSSTIILAWLKLVEQFKFFDGFATVSNPLTNLSSWNLPFHAWLTTKSLLHLHSFTLYERYRCVPRAQLLKCSVFMNNQLTCSTGRSIHRSLVRTHQISSYSYFSGDAWPRALPRILESDR